ncbi:MAG: TadE family protein [Terriglobales bacterium]
MKRLTHRLRGSDGAEIAEAAMVMPVVFVFLLGIIWFGRAFNIYSTIQQAAQQGAIYAARPTCAACGNSFPGISGASGVSGVVEAVMNASSVNPASINQSSPSPGAGLIPCPPPAPPPPSTGPCSQATDFIWVCSSVELNSVLGQPVPCGTLVSFQYPFQFYLPFTSLNLSQVMLSAQAQSRMEY